jgi:hypothetical protein
LIHLPLSQFFCDRSFQHTAGNQLEFSFSKHLELV